MSATTILKEKGYNSSEIIDIIHHGTTEHESLDMQVRRAFRIDFLVNLTDVYHSDETEDELNDLANQRCFFTGEDLLLGMHSHLISLASNYPIKK